jgi:integrase
MGKDTLNRAIAKLFGKEPGKKLQPENKMGDLTEFTVHDLRRTCRSLLAAVGVPGHVAERCLNHKLKGVEGIYDRYDYYEERKQALNKVAEMVTPVINADR